jgi:hypothetical protein
MAKPLGFPEYRDFRDDPDVVAVYTLKVYLKKLREWLSLRQEDAAQLFGVTLTTIKRYEYKTSDHVAPPAYVAFLFRLIVDKASDLEKVEELENFLLKEFNAIREHQGDLEGKAYRPWERMSRIVRWDELEQFVEDYKRKNKTKEGKLSDIKSKAETFHPPLLRPPRVENFTGRDDELDYLLQNLQQTE